MIDQFGGRKFVLVVVLVVGFFGLAFGGQISFSELKSVVEVLTIGYIGGNVVQKFAPTSE